MSSIYRQCKLGDSLVEALDVLIKEGKVTPDVAYKVLGEAMVKALSSKVHNRASFRGNLDNYRFCDNVWTFVLSNASFKTSYSPNYVPDVLVDKIKIVCVDNRYVEPDGPSALEGETAMKMEPL